MKKYITKTEEETKELAKSLAKEMNSAKTICLNGQLGAGKTTFTQGFALGLGVEKQLNSPTFVIMKIYEANHPKIKKLVHIDAYRLESAHDLENIGVYEYFERDDTLILIEWAEKVKELLPKDAKTINFEINDNGRTIRVDD